MRRWLCKFGIHKRDKFVSYILEYNVYTCKYCGDIKVKDW